MGPFLATTPLPTRRIRGRPRHGLRRRVAAVAIHGALLWGWRAAGVARAVGRAGLAAGGRRLWSAARLPRLVDFLAQVCGHGVGRRHLDGGWKWLA